MRNEPKLVEGIEMLSYEQKLATITEGRSLIRLPRPIRDKANICCDACGSNYPRTFMPLRIRQRTATILSETPASKNWSS